MHIYTFTYLGSEGACISEGKEVSIEAEPEFANRQKRFVMKPPQICKEGTKKTVWINFAEICTMYIDVLDFCLLNNSMHRETDHVLAYVFAELGTHGSLDGSQRLVIRGSYQPKQIENIIRKYIS